MNSKKGAIVFVVLAASMWGTLGISVKILSAFGFSALQMVIARLLISSVFLGSYLMIMDKKKLQIERKDIKWFVVTGIFSMLFFNTCYSTTVQLTSLSVAAVLLYTSPVFVTLLSIPIFNEKITKKKIISIGCSILGCIFVSGIFSGDSLNVPLLGFLLGIASSIGYALYGITAKLLVKKYETLTILFYTFLFAGIGGLFIGDIGGIIEIIGEKPMALGAVALAALFCSIIPYILYTLALKRIEPSRASIIASIEPVIATVLGICLFHEKLSLIGLMGIISILFAIYILSVKSES